jgi:hypothetical protein
MEYETTEGNRKNSVLHWCNGKAYVKEKVKDDRFILRCRHWKGVFTCPGRAFIKDMMLHETVVHRCESTDPDKQVNEKESREYN